MADIKWNTSLPALTKLKFGGSFYYFKDAEARTQLQEEVTAREGAITKVLEDAKSYADTKVGQLSLVTYELVTELPAADATSEFNKSKKVYLKKEHDTVGDIFCEYICVEKTDGTFVWEKIGDSNIDLSNFYTKSDIDGKVTTLNTAIESEKTRAQSVEAELKQKIETLDGQALKAVPQATNDTFGGFKTGHIEGVGEAAVKLDTEGKAYVNATQYTAKANGGLKLEGTEFSIKEVSTDLLKNGANTFIINGGGAAE